MNFLFVKGPVAVLNLDDVHVGQDKLGNRIRVQEEFHAECILHLFLQELTPNFGIKLTQVTCYMGTYPGEHKHYIAYYKPKLSDEQLTDLRLSFLEHLTSNHTFK